MSLHGQAGKTIARTLELRGIGLGGSDNSGPERLFLNRVEDEAIVGGALAPRVMDKGLPVLNVGRGPRSESFGAACTMECGMNGTCCAFAGRNHESAAAQPRIDLSNRCHFTAQSFAVL